jgi:hypothetical protein
MGVTKAVIAAAVLLHPLSATALPTIPGRATTVQHADESIRNDTQLACYGCSSSEYQRAMEESHQWAREKLPKAWVDGLAKPDTRATRYRPELETTMDSEAEAEALAVVDGILRSSGTGNPGILSDGQLSEHERAIFEELEKTFGPSEAKKADEPAKTTEGEQEDEESEEAAALEAEERASLLEGIQKYAIDPDAVMARLGIEPKEVEPKEEVKSKKIKPHEVKFEEIKPVPFMA